MANQQEQKDNPLLVAVTGLGIVFIIVLFFIGMLYVTRANLLISAISSIIFAVVFLAIVYLLVQSKTRKRMFRVRGDELKDRTPEIIMEIVYAVFVLASFPVIFHAVEFEFLNKDNIKKAAFARISNIVTLETRYKAAVGNKQKELETEVETALAALPNEDAENKIVTLLGLSREIFTNYKNKDEASRQVIKDDIRSALLSKQKVIAEQYAFQKADTVSISSLQVEVKRTFNSWNRTRLSLDYELLGQIYNQMLAVMKTKMSDFDPGQPQTTPDIKFDEVFSTFSQAPWSRIISVFVLVLILHTAVQALYLGAKRPSAEWIIRNRKKQYIQGNI